MAGDDRKNDDAFCFINVSSTSAAPNVSREALGLVRSHAMKVVRRREMDEHNQKRTHAAINDTRAQGAPSSRGPKSPWDPAAPIDVIQNDLQVWLDAIDHRDGAGSGEAIEEISSIPRDPVDRTAFAAPYHYNFLGDNVPMSKDLILHIHASSFEQTLVEKIVEDSMRLLHFGKMNDDQRVILEARRSQLAGVQILKTGVQTLHDPNSVLSAAQMLLLSELYSDAEDSQSWKSWSTHLNAMAVVIRQSSDPETTPNLRAFLLHQYQHSSLMYSLLNRVCFIDEQAWEICTSRGCLLICVKELFHLARQLIELLQCIDICGSQISTHIEAPDLCTRTSQWRDLDNAYERWLLNFDRATEQSPGENDAASKPDNAFKVSPFLEATCRTFYWTCLLILRQSLFEHWGQHHEEFSHLVVQAKTELCAKHLRDLIEHHLQARHVLLSKILAVRAPLHFASKWFALWKDGANLRWCKEQEAAL